MRGFLDLRRLRYFKAIAERGSLSGAARALYLAQPALSHHIAQLELQIGVPLLVRRHDGVSLTDAGMLLLGHASDISARVERAETELSALGGESPARIKIRLAVISSLAADLTPILVAALAREVPEVVLRITESGTRDSRDLLDRGKADVAVYLTGADGDVPLAMERLYLVGAGEGADANRPVPFADVLDQRLVMPACGNPLRALLEAAAAEMGRSLDVGIEIDGTAPRRNAVLAGLGSTVFGAHFIHGAERQTDLVVRPIVEPVMVRPIYFGARRGLDPDLATRIRAVLADALAGFDGMEARIDSAVI